MEFIRPFRDALVSSEKESSISEDEGRRKGVLKLLLAQIKGLGEGNDKGVFVPSYQYYQVIRNFIACHRNRRVFQSGVLSSPGAVSARLGRVYRVGYFSA